MIRAVKVLPDWSLGYIRVASTLTGKDLLGGIQRLYSDPEWQAGFSTLWDGHGLKGIEILPFDLTAYVERSGEMAGRQGTGKVAVVVPKDHADYATQLLLIRRDPDVRPWMVHFTIQDALAWLDAGGAVEALKGSGGA